jgi:filamentous hemagglutinin family protein
LINGTLNGSSITDLKPGAVIQLGTTAGSAGSFAEIDFHGLNIAAGDTLTIKSGAPGQSIMLVNVDAGASSIAGALMASGGNGTAAPVVYLQNPNGITVELSGSIIAPAGLSVDTLGNTATTGQPLVNNGVLDGGGSLQLFGARINGSGSFKGNAVVVSTFGSANNPVNGAHFLSNGLQLSPSSGSTVALTLNGYGSTPQALNVKVNGDAVAAMPSTWPAGSSLPPNNLPVPPGGSRPAGAPAPGFGGGSMIVQATGTLTLANSNDFVFPGAIVLKSAGALDVNGVVINNSWTGAGQSFQGVFFESPSIVSTSGLIQVLTNNLNWVNFSTLPHAPVRTWQLVPGSNGALGHLAADSVAPHRNTYSILIEAAAAGQCWVCLVNTAPVNMQ